MPDVQVEHRWWTPSVHVEYSCVTVTASTVCVDRTSNTWDLVEHDPGKTRWDPSVVRFDCAISVHFAAGQQGAAPHQGARVNVVPTLFAFVLSLPVRVLIILSGFILCLGLPR